MPEITHGPNIGRTTYDGFRIWLRLEKEGYTRILFLEGSSLNNKVSEKELLEKFKG